MNLLFPAEQDRSLYWQATERCWIYHPEEKKKSILKPYNEKWPISLAYVPKPPITANKRRIKQDNQSKYGDFIIAQRWEHLPPTNVARVRFPDSASNVGEFTGSLLRTERFSPGTPVSPLLQNLFLAPSRNFARPDHVRAWNRVYLCRLAYFDASRVIATSAELTWP